MGVGCTRRCSWETPPIDESAPAFFRDFTQIWQRAEKVVYSRTLESASSARTRIEPSFEPERVRRLKETIGHDLSVGGANLAAQAIRASLVDEFQLLVVPVIVGGGKPWLPNSLSLKLKLLESRRFASGVVFLRYRPK
jgi:dihydrofolate reductase